MSHALMPSRSSICRAKRLAPRLRPEHAGLQAEFHARLLRGLTEIDRVRRRAGQDVRLEVTQHRQLAFGLPRGHRQHGGAERDATLVDADATREQPVAVRVLDGRLRCRSRRGQRAGAHAGPELEVAAGVADQRGPPAGAAAAVHRDDLLARHRQHPERVRVPEIPLRRRRQRRQVLDIGRGPDPRVLQPVPLHPVLGQQPVHQPPQRAQLQGRPLVRRHRLGRRLEHRPTSRTSAYPPACTIYAVPRGCGAAGSAPHWQCGGQGFESPQLHPREQARPTVRPGGRRVNGARQSASYSSCRWNQLSGASGVRASLRPRGARSSHWYMPQRPSSPRAYAE